MLSLTFIRQSIVLFLSLLRCRVSLPGEFYELNVHFGVLVGGMGDFSEIFLGNQETFRGCMEDVLFNGIDVLEEARRVSEAGSRSLILEQVSEKKQIEIILGPEIILLRALVKFVLAVVYNFCAAQHSRNHVQVLFPVPGSVHLMNGCGG